VYTEDNKRFDASIVDVPLPITKAKESATTDTAIVNPFVVNAISVAELITSLEKMYGIEIEVEDENINNCHFSGDLSDMNLYVKMDIICQSLTASYEKKGTKIFIKGKGCN
jgi:acyl carrier protein